ncbi:hypothetical protein O9993_01670 [Vibrio lentus]|nr:hypothetical protein [Vibrio lentus]
MQDKNRPLVNRAALGIYPPLRLSNLSLLLRHCRRCLITPNTTRNDPGYWKIPNSKQNRFRDWLRWGHSKVVLVKAIEESIDTFFFNIADLGIDQASNG